MFHRNVLVSARPTVPRTYIFLLPPNKQQYSLRLALEELGYPTLHTQHLYENHEIFNMWSDEIFNPSIEADEVLMGRPNFDLMAERGFAGTMDFPSSL